MGRIFLYSRVSTDQQTLAQQERTVYEWLKAHGLSVDTVVSDEGVSGGVSFANRKLGTELLPMMQEGDTLIVSEISRLGRSMFDLSKLIHTELKPRKLRLVVVSMGIDLRCDKLSAIDELILNNFSFAAQLEKQLVSERTLSALAVRKQQGCKLGGANEKWRESYYSKSEVERSKFGEKRGKSKNARFLESKDVQAFIRALRNVFAEHTNGEPREWHWKDINTCGDSKYKLVSLMKDYHSFDNELFRTWNFDAEPRKLQARLSSYIQTLRESILKNERFNKQDNE